MINRFDKGDHLVKFMEAEVNIIYKRAKNHNRR
jgi:hypothetical protein